MLNLYRMGGYLEVICGVLVAVIIVNLYWVYWAPSDDQIVNIPSNVFAKSQCWYMAKHY